MFIDHHHRHDDDVYINYNNKHLFILFDIKFDVNLINGKTRD